MRSTYCSTATAFRYASLKIEVLWSVARATFLKATNQPSDNCCQYGLIANARGIMAKSSPVRSSVARVIFSESELRAKFRENAECRSVGRDRVADV